MTTLQEAAMRKALDVMTRQLEIVGPTARGTSDAIESLKAALAQQVEPVAYLVYDKGASSQYVCFDDELGDTDGLEVTPLYTAAPAPVAQQGEQQPCKVCEHVHAILDADESMIVRDAKDGYPEGRTPRALTLQERVTALCVYAADWKRWYEETQAAPAPVAQSVKEMPHGWVVNWPDPNGGTKPVYHASSIKPKFGAELDGKLTMYAVYTHPQTAPQPAQAMKAEFETLLGEYWDIAHTEGETGLSQSNEANEVLCKLRTLLQSAQPVAPHECKTEAEKLAYAFGWWKALEVNRVQPVAQTDVCCGNYGNCHKPCTPRGRWQAEQALPVAPLTVDDFEEWHKANFTQSLDRRGYTYSNAHVRNRWIGWQAAHGKAPAPLTDTQIESLGIKHLRYQIEGLGVSGVFDFARAIEAAIKDVK